MITNMVTDSFSCVSNIRLVDWIFGISSVFCYRIKKYLFNVRRPSLIVHANGSIDERLYLCNCKCRRPRLLVLVTTDTPGEAATTVAPAKWMNDYSEQTWYYPPSDLAPAWLAFSPVSTIMQLAQSP